ncbi:MAG: hypothetical protein ACYDHX_13685 [Methanothrix sp.]
MAPQVDERSQADERLLASAIRFLIDGGEDVAANVLLSCSLDRWVVESFCFGEEVYKIAIKLTGPRAAYETLNNKKHPIRQAVEHALDACIQENESIGYITVHAELIDIDPDWRSELLEIARGSGVSNQAAGERAAKILNWNNLGFRSASEIKIAQALDKAGVLFLPNCKTRLGSGENRQNREPDFLVCHNGKWGILEVDGEPFHQPSRTVADHERDRLFKIHGITVAEHYDANKCFNKPDEVVNEFLRILDQ